MAALQNAESQRTFIRSKRDWLYRTQRAWQSLLLEWDVAGTSFDEGMMLLLGRSYQFLAPALHGGHRVDRGAQPGEEGKARPADGLVSWAGLLRGRRRAP